MKTPKSGKELIAAYESGKLNEQGQTVEELERELAKAGIVFFDAADFVNAEVEQPVWIVNDFIAKKMKGDLCGPSKTEKTFFARALGESIATGRTFLGAYHVDRAHKVAYLDLELMPWNSQERLQANTRADGIDWERHKGNFIICHLRGIADKLRDEHKGVNVVLNNMIQYLELRGTEIVIIDPRYKLLKAGEDENTGDGLRGILSFRDELAKHFAVLLVTHDPKGDTSQKKTTDRGAGSYTAGADYDFRIALDRAEGWTVDNKILVVENSCRARKEIPPFVARFYDTLSFTRDDSISPVKMDGRNVAKRNTESRAAQEAATQKAFREAALQVVEGAYPKMLSVEEFDAAVAKVKGASVGINQRLPMRKMLIASNVLSTCQQKVIENGKVKNKKNGFTFISTPERIAQYLKGFGL